MGSMHVFDLRFMKNSWGTAACSCTPHCTKPSDGTGLSTPLTDTTLIGNGKVQPVGERGYWYGIVRHAVRARGNSHAAAAAALDGAPEPWKAGCRFASVSPLHGIDVQGGVLPGCQAACSSFKPGRLLKRCLSTGKLLHFAGRWEEECGLATSTTATSGLSRPCSMG